jgi:hypothetical protein
MQLGNASSFLFFLLLLLLLLLLVLLVLLVVLVLVLLLLLLFFVFFYCLLGLCLFINSEFDFDLIAISFFPSHSV